MKTHVFQTVFALLLLVPPTFAGTQDFAILNLTPTPILSVHASPSGNTDWEEDLLGDTTLSPGESVWFNIEGYNDCEWDIRVVRKNAAAGDDFYGIDLCAVAGLVLVVVPPGDVMAVPVFANSTGLPAWAAQMQSLPTDSSAGTATQMAPAAQPLSGMLYQLPQGMQPIQAPHKMMCFPNFFQMPPEEQRMAAFASVMGICVPSDPAAEGRQAEIDARYADMQSRIDSLRDSVRDIQAPSYGVSRYGTAPTGDTITWDPEAAAREHIPYVPFSPEVYPW